MSRDNFISDNLINIRESLRKEQSAQAIDSATSNGTETQTHEPAKRMPSELPAPAPRMQLRAPELDRERRELIGRIRRDYTLTAAELEQMDIARKEAAVFMEFLANQQNTLEKLDLDRNDISRELDRLAWEYYQRSGRWRAFSSGTAQKESSEPAHTTVRTGSRLTAAAIIISALLISGTILAVFL
ncbi:MAG: hypothetical protein IJC21_05145 [Lentisphaeria bacterium]|nr:hypothetical protein [Lentisphaeria bacterium]